MSLRGESIRDSIALLEAQLGAENPEKRSDLIEVVFNDQEKWVPPGYESTDHFIWRKMPKSPDNVNGQHYMVPLEEISPSHPWFKRV